MSEVVPSSAPSRSRRRVGFTRYIALSAITFAVLWLLHPPIFAWGLRLLGERVLPSTTGIEIRATKIRADMADAIRMEGVRVRVVRPEVSRTLVRIGHLELHFPSVWGALFGDHRLFSLLSIEGMEGILDFRRQALPPKRGGDHSRDEQEVASTRLLHVLPLAAHATGVNLGILIGENQTYRIEGGSIDLSEHRLGSFYASRLGIEAGPIRQEVVKAEAVTAWKRGVFYLSDFHLRPDVALDSFSLDLVRPGGVGLAFEVGLLGGDLRCDIGFGSKGGALTIDSASWASNIDLAPLSALLNMPGKASGKLREGRFIFRGAPSRPAEAEASLRVVADGFSWNGRGWESLELGANLIGRKVYLADFNLRQSGNRLAATGEMILAGKFADFLKSTFLLDVSGEIHNLGALSGLLGEPFDKMSGELSLASRLSGRDGNLDGFLNLEAWSAQYRGVPIRSGKIRAVFKNNEACLVDCELWSGKDLLSARGSIQIPSPHQYAGEVDLDTQDLAAYNVLFGLSGGRNVLGGGLKLRWQGDGSAVAHSGAFSSTLSEFTTSETPEGVSGTFEGTYSPENIYFKQFALRRGPLELTSTLTLATSGVQWGGIELRGGKKTLLSGEMFLPLDPFAVLKGKDPLDALDAAKPLAISLQSEQLDLRSLLELGGQPANFGGQIHLVIGATGPAGAPLVSGTLAIKGLGGKTEGMVIPASDIQATLSATGGRAELLGSLSTGSQPPVTLKASVPFGLSRGGDGRPTLMDHSAPIAGEIVFTRTNLAALRPMLARVRRVEGELSGRVEMKNNLLAPEFFGRLDLASGVLDIAPSFPVLGTLSGALLFDRSKVTLDGVSGEAGGGPFKLSASMDFGDRSNPRYAAGLEGQKMLLVSAPGLSLRANVDLKAEGDNAGGFVRGRIGLVDSLCTRCLEIVPATRIRRPNGAQKPVGRDVWARIPQPFAAWKLDLAVQDDGPFLAVGEGLTDGRIITDLKVVGSPGDPRPDGAILLHDISASLPFCALKVREGRITFSRDTPRLPSIELRGSASMADHRIEAYAFGPLGEGNLMLRSSPALSQDVLAFILATGGAPDTGSTLRLVDASCDLTRLPVLLPFRNQLGQPPIDAGPLLVRPLAPGSIGAWDTRAFSLLPEPEGGIFKGGSNIFFRLR